MKTLASLSRGLIFGCGLLISGTTQPPKVLGFLDLLGRWNPTLAFVMAGAPATACAGYALARCHERPIFAARYTDIDQPLIVGSMLGLGRTVSGSGAGKSRELILARNRICPRDDRRDEREGPVEIARAIDYGY